MTKASFEQSENNPMISIEQASKMFGELFEKKENQPIVAKLFEWLPWLAREQKVQETIQTVKWWLQDLKNTIV